MSNQMQPQPVGADRPGYGWRQERRQAKNAGMYDPNAQPQGRQGAQGGWGNMGGQFAGAQAQGDQNYWTPERMRNAKPMPMPTMPGGGMLDSYSGMNGGFNPWGGMQGGGMNDFIRSSMMYGANAPMYANQGGYNPNANQGGAAPQGKMPTSVPPQSRSRVRRARRSRTTKGASSTPSSATSCPQASATATSTSRTAATVRRSTTTARPPDGSR